MTIPEVTAEGTMSTRRSIASRGDRLIAVMIDMFLIGVVASALQSFLPQKFFVNLPGIDKPLLYAALTVVYYWLMEASARQATLGKSAFNLKVVDLKGNRLSCGRALIRAVTRLIGIGWFVACFSSLKQGLHDLAADSLVVDVGVDEPE